MRVVVSVILPDGTQVDRPPTEEELAQVAERYAVALLQASLPGSRVRVVKRNRRAAAASE